MARYCLKRSEIDESKHKIECGPYKSAEECGTGCSAGCSDSSSTSGSSSSEVVCPQGMITCPGYSEPVARDPKNSCGCPPPPSSSTSGSSSSVSSNSSSSSSHLCPQFGLPMCDCGFESFVDEDGCTQYRCKDCSSSTSGSSSSEVVCPQGMITCPGYSEPVARDPKNSCGCPPPPSSSSSYASSSSSAASSSSSSSERFNMLTEDLGNILAENGSIIVWSR